MKAMNLRLDPKMRKALEMAARNEISSVSAVIRRAISQYLRTVHGVKWEELEAEEDEHGAV